MATFPHCVGQFRKKEYVADAKGWGQLLALLTLSYMQGRWAEITGGILFSSREIHAQGDYVNQSGRSQGPDVLIPGPVPFPLHLCLRTL